MPFTATIHKWVLVVLVLSGSPSHQPALLAIPYMGTEAMCEEQAAKLAAKWLSEARVRVLTYCAQTWYRP
mgnify:FL=1